MLSWCSLSFRLHRRISQFYLHICVGLQTQKPTKSLAGCRRMPHQGRRQCHDEKSVPDFISMGKELCRAGLQLTSYREERVREIARERVIDKEIIKLEITWIVSITWLPWKTLNLTICIKLDDSREVSNFSLRAQDQRRSGSSQSGDHLIVR